MAGKNRTVCIPFSPNARKRPPPWQYLREMHVSRDQDGKILALCVHFQAQSGDSGCMARESCHQGPLFASRARKSCMMRRCCQRCPTFRGTAARVTGPRTGRTGFVPCGPGLVRLPYRGSLPFVHARRAYTLAKPPPPAVPPIAAIRTPAPHPNAAVTRAAAFIAAALHVAPAVPTTPRARRRHPSRCSSQSGGGEPPIGRPRRPVVIRARAHHLRFPLPAPAARHPRPVPIAHVARTSPHPANERNCTRNSMWA